MKIVIDARMYSESGIGRYLRNLISNVQELDQQNEYFVLLLKKDFENELCLDSRFRGNDKENNFHKVLADFRWYTITEQIKLPRILNKLKPDLVHFPHFNVPFFYSGKFVVTIHDLIHQHFSMRQTTRNFLTYGLKHLGYTQIFRNAVKNAENIFVPSEYVKGLLKDKWAIDGEKIVVTPEGVDDKLIAIADSLSKRQSEKILDKFGIKSRYIFYVGNAHPHKNVEGLIKAFILLRKKYQSLQLVLSGADNFFWQKIKKEFRLQDIVYTGKVTEEELVALYKNAGCFVTASLEEGFGLPILEAMACGTPVVSSNATSLLEVGGDGAIYFDPQDTLDMEDKISKVLDSEKLRNELIEKSKKRVKKFSWQKMTQQTLEVYKECV